MSDLDFAQCHDHIGHAGNCGSCLRRALGFTDIGLCTESAKLIKDAPFSLFFAVTSSVPGIQIIEPDVHTRRF